MIKLENVEKSYDGTRVLKGINLEIETGDFVSIMGFPVPANLRC